MGPQTAILDMFADYILIEARHLHIHKLHAGNLGRKGSGKQCCDARRVAHPHQIDLFDPLAFEPVSDAHLVPGPLAAWLAVLTAACFSSKD